MQCLNHFSRLIMKQSSIFLCMERKLGKQGPSNPLLEIFPQKVEMKTHGRLFLVIFRLMNQAEKLNLQIRIEHANNGKRISGQATELSADRNLTLQNGTGDIFSKNTQQQQHTVQCTRFESQKAPGRSRSSCTFFISEHARCSGVLNAMWRQVTPFAVQLHTGTNLSRTGNYGTHCRVELQIRRYHEPVIKPAPNKLKLHAQHTSSQKCCKPALLHNYLKPTKQNLRAATEVWERVSKIPEQLLLAAIQVLFDLHMLCADM